MRCDERKKGVSNHQIQQEDNFSYKMRYIRDLQFLLDSLFDRDNRSGNNHRVEYLISSLFVTDRFFKMILFLAKRIGAEIRISISKRKFEKKRRFSLSLSLFRSSSPRHDIEFNFKGKRMADTKGPSTNEQQVSPN